ncbi:MAG TPA: aldo/keto reductase [Sphingomonas sp.]|nr:aldo/keto reductase [Sphingomonas sp.]
MANLGSLDIGTQGFGAMGLSNVYGQADDAESIRTIHRATELGIRLFDTATGYGDGHNEQLLGRALGDRRDRVVIASKFTHRRGDSDEIIGARQAVEASLQRLNVDHIDLYYLHRVDPLVPIEDSVGELGRLQAEGKIGAVGVSEADAGQIRRAHAVTPLAALQSEYSLWTREVEAEILPTVRALGIAFVAYSPLGRGFLAGGVPREQGDRRFIHPRFQKEAILANARRRRIIEDAAERLYVTPAQISLAWVLSKNVFPIPGTRHVSHLEDNVAAGGIVLDAGTIAELDEAFPHGATAGDRYPPEQMKFVPRQPELA